MYIDFRLTSTREVNRTVIFFPGAVERSGPEKGHKE